MCLTSKVWIMEKTFDLIDDAANFTSAGTSQLTVNTSQGLEYIEIENLSELDSDFKSTDIGKLYAEFPENFIKIQKIRFRQELYFYCYFSNNAEVSILKFDSEGKLMEEKRP